MRIMAAITLIPGKRLMRKSVGFFRLLMTIITLTPRLYFEEVLKIGNMRSMTSSAFAIFDRFMHKIPALNLRHKLRMTVPAEFRPGFPDQSREAGSVRGVTGCTLTFYHRLMPNFPLKSSLIMTIKTVARISRGTGEQNQAKNQYRFYSYISNAAAHELPP